MLNKRFKRVFVAAVFLFLTLTGHASVHGVEEINESIPKSPKVTEENRTDAGETATVKSLYTLNDYFRLKENEDYVYTSFEGTTESKSEFLSSGTAQFKEKTAGRNYLRFVTVTEDYATVTDKIPYGGLRENRITYMPEGLMVLKAPLETGNTWESMGYTFTITEIKEVSGNGIIKVLRKRSEEEAIYTFTLGKGMTEFRDSAGRFTKLSEIKSGQPEKIEAIFYFPGGKEVKSLLEFYTNDSIRDILTSKYKETGKEAGSDVLGNGTRINYIYSEGENVRIDLNSEFPIFAGQDPQKEDEIIKSLARTVCKLYEKKGLLITVNDGRYESLNKKIENYEIILP